MSGKDKVFDLMEKMYGEFSQRFDVLENDVKEVKSEVNGLKKEVTKTNIVIEHDVKPKIEALFDGYTQLNEKVDRIEDQVTKQEEFIIKRVK